MKRDVAVVATLWLLLTAVGELLAVVGDFYPLARSDKGEEIEEAFRILVFFAIPVLTLVVAALVYTVLRHRVTGEPTEDGAALQGRGPVPLAWFGVTAALTLAIMIYPGLTSIPGIIRDESNPDLLVQVEGVQWTWLISYPQHDVSRVNELVLPKDQVVRFEISSLDVLHSFWVPAFLMKIDAVPGRTTTITLRPTEAGTFDTDPMLRVQCAELCGLAHSQMQIPVQIVSGQEFEQWLAEQQAAVATPTGAPAATLKIVSKDILFDRETLTAPAGKPFAIEFDNQDAGVPHNVAIYTDDSATEALSIGAIFPGPEVRTYQVTPLDAGSYFFRCDVHPTTMTGALVVE